MTDTIDESMIDAEETVQEAATMTPEQERLREQIARYEFSNISGSRFPSHDGVPFEELPNDWWSKVRAYKRADYIIALEGLEVIADDQNIKVNIIQTGFGRKATIPDNVFKLVEKEVP